MNYKTNKTIPQRVATPTDRRSAAGGGAAASLVTVTKSASPFGNSAFEIVSNDGEIHSFNRDDDGTLKVIKTPEAARALRWSLKSIVNKILTQSRTAKCQVFRAPIPNGLRNIEIRKTVEHNKAFYTGLYACGNVWACPVCATKVSERRRAELVTAISIAKAKGWQINFITLTIPHGISDDLKVMKDLQQKALRKISSGKNSVKNLLEKQGVEVHGYIRAYEVTHGLNGFHPHFHIIYFTSEIEHRYIERIYTKKWQQACSSVGLPTPSDEHGFHIQDGSFAAEYAVKWGIVDEMLKANTKITKRKGVSPFGLLKAVLDGDNEDYPADYARKLFAVYVESMKGARQLYWSNGLRLKLGLAQEMRDQEIAQAETEESSRYLATILPEQWKIIHKKRISPVRILEIAESLPVGLDEHLIFGIIVSMCDRTPKKKKDKSP
ncbi:MAG: replication protein [Inoviridae sp.]|nr:MAG: replication protein [Inoviridae sp.]